MDSYLDSNYFATISYACMQDVGGVVNESFVSMFLMVLAGSF